MGSLLDYGTVSEGVSRPPARIERDPRGASGDDFLGIIVEQRDHREAEEDYWRNMAEENDFGYTNYIGKAVGQESMLGNLFDVGQDYVQDFDPQFDPEPFIDPEWPTWRQEAVMEAKNAKHAAILTERTHEQWLYEQEGQYHGSMTPVLQLGAGFANPENYLLGIGEVAVLTKLGLAGMTRVAAGMTYGSLTAAAQEAAVVANNKSRDEMGIAVAAGIGGLVGGGLSFITPKSLKAAQDLDEAIGKSFSGAWKNDMDVAAGDIKVGHTFYRSPDAQAWADAVKDGTAAVDVDGSYIVTAGEQAFRYESKAQAVAAKRLIDKKIEPTPSKIQEQIDLEYEDLAAKYDKLVPRRKGIKGASIGLKGRSDANPFTRWMHHLLTEDASGTGGKAVSTPSGALRQDMYAAQMRSAWHPVRFQMIKQWQKETGTRVWTPWDLSHHRKFDDAVVRELGYRRNPKYRPDGEEVLPSVKKAADAYENLNNMRFKRMQESGVAGYAGMDADNLYIKHKWDGISLTRAAREYGEENVVQLLARAILRGGEFDRTWKYAKLGDKLNDDFKARTSQHMARAIYNRFTRRPDTVNIARTGWLSKKDTRELRARVQSIVENPEDIKHIMNAAEGKDARAINELLSQIDLDVNASFNGLSVRNLMDTNLGASMDTEIRRSAGKSAMADMGFESQDAFLEMTELAGRWNRKNKTDLSAPELERLNLENQKLWNLMMGENLENSADSSLARTARGFRKASTLASLNQVGFAQASETGRLVGALTVKNFINQIPEYGRMIRSMKNGTFKDDMLNDIEAAFGVRLGDNEILNNPSLMGETGGVGIAANEQQTWLSGLDNAMNKALHVQGYLNGMNYVMKAQHRMHARGFSMRLFEDLQKAKIPTRRLKRYADMGLGSDDLKAIKAQMDKHTEMGAGWFGQTRPINMHFAKYDAAVLEKVGLAFWKNQAQTVQRTIGGESAWWMEGTAGKLFSQFRTFPIVAIEKQTLHDLKHLDVEAFTTLTASLGFASLAYTTKTYANSFGLPARKRKQYLKNRLTPEKIAAGAASWAGQAAIFPDVMRTAGDFGLDNPFMWTYQKGQQYRNHYREKRLDAGAFGAAPSMLDSAYRFATGVGQAALTPAEFRADTWKHAIRIAPFGNNLLIKTLQNTTTE